VNYLNSPVPGKAGCGFRLSRSIRRDCHQIIREDNTKGTRTTFESGSHPNSSIILRRSPGAVLLIVAEPAERYFLSEAEARGGVRTSSLHLHAFQSRRIVSSSPGLRGTSYPGNVRVCAQLRRVAPYRIIHATIPICVYIHLVSQPKDAGFLGDKSLGISARVLGAVSETA